MEAMQVTLIILLIGLQESTWETSTEQVRVGISKFLVGLIWEMLMGKVKSRRNPALTCYHLQYFFIFLLLKYCMDSLIIV